MIFFSILNYIGDTYGFSKEIDCQFDLITGKFVRDLPKRLWQDKTSANQVQIFFR